MGKHRCKKSSDPISLSNMELPIVSFDVSENGRILLGLEEDKIAVADEKKILAFFDFTTGGSYYVQWKDDNILLLLVRSSIIVEMTQDGQLVNMIRADDRSIHNGELRRQIDQRKQVDVGEYSYRLQNNMGMLNILTSSYSQLVKIDLHGKATMLYDVHVELLTRTIFIITGVAALFVIIIVKITYPIVKAQRK